MNKTFIVDKQITYLNVLANLLITKKDPKGFYLKYKDEFSTVNPFNVFSINVFLDDELKISQIKEIAGKLVNLLRSGLLSYNWNNDISIIQKLLEEGRKIKKKFSGLKKFIKNKDYESFKNNLDILPELNKRILKMQNVIFSVLESKSVNPKPLKVMWSLYDDVKYFHKLLQDALVSQQEVNTILGKYYFLVLGIIEKEELFILPILSCILSVTELADLELELNSYGYAFINEELKFKEPNIKYLKTTDDYLFKSENGMLKLDELLAILNFGDFTFVDNENKVKFFSAPHKHFARSSSLIGRDVRNCHPSKSVEIVEEIIEKFRSGSEDRVDFWIDLNDKKILISYFAIRSNDYKYLGVLEFTQDITNIINISGEKRINNFQGGENGSNRNESTKI